MPALQFGTSSYARARGDLPSLPVINMFAEEAPTEEGGIVLQSRPGLSDTGQNMGNGPVAALFQRDGVLSGDLVGVSDGKLWRSTTEIDAIAGSGAASIAGNEAGVMAGAGAGLVFYDGAASMDVAFPDGANVVKVIQGASRFIALREGTGKFYWTSALGSTFDALSFATAENSPDGLLDALFMGDTLFLFGTETVEPWPNTSDNDLPFVPLEGSVIPKGIKATGCATQIGTTFAWVTNENQVTVSNEDGVISSPGLEERIEASSAVRLFTFLLGGYEFLALRLDDETQVWSSRSKRWSEFTSAGQTNWLPACFAGGIFGSGTDGALLEWGAGHEDLGGTMERRFRAGTPINAGGVTIHNTVLRCNVGQTPFLEGDYVAPSAEMRLSRDGGQTWGFWRSAPLGAQGDYRRRVQWRACGQAAYPAHLAEFRVTAPIDFRASGVTVNEPFGGR